MVQISYILNVLAAASVVVAAPYPIHLHAAKAQAAYPKAKAKGIYFMTHNAAGNSIIATKVATDGTLSSSSITRTNGKGISAHRQQHEPNRPLRDALSHKSALKVEANTMIAMHPTSNPITLMTINAADPCELNTISPPAPKPHHLLHHQCQNGLPPLLQQHIKFPTSRPIRPYQYNPPRSSSKSTNPPYSPPSKTTPLPINKAYLATQHPRISNAHRAPSPYEQPPPPSAPLTLSTTFAKSTVGN